MIYGIITKSEDKRLNIKDQFQLTGHLGHSLEQVLREDAAEARARLLQCLCFILMIMGTVTSKNYRFSKY